MDTPKLFMLLIGCKPKGRNIEQHDIFFGIGNTVKDVIPDLIKFWPEAGNTIHIDAWREVTHVNGYTINITNKEASTITQKRGHKLFFINLGGYRPNEFEEYHYKVLAVADQKRSAIKAAMQTTFYKHTRFEGAESHVDDKYGIDVDDSYEIEDLLPVATKEKFSIVVSENRTNEHPDEIHLGYFKLSKIQALRDSKA